MVVCRAPEKVCYLSSVKTHCSLYARAGGPMFQAAALSHIGERFEKYPSEACMTQLTRGETTPRMTTVGRTMPVNERRVVLGQAAPGAITVAPPAIHSIRTQ